jgi:serine/threonine protein kinase
MPAGREHQATIESFVQAALRSRLLNRDELQSALRDLPPDLRSDPHVFADHLVRVGKLSRFQAGKLLKGTALGLVLGPFEVVAPIGRGGMGAVYLARDTRSRELVALKVLPPKRARREERTRARFQREMLLCQRVAHPHIARTQEVGEYRGVYFIAMEFIPGRSLHRLVHDGGPLSVPRAARLLTEVAAALEYAHGQGLIHRDLKPSNIMVTPNDHAKVLDLGLAILVDETPGPREVVGGQGYVVGSMDFIAPEQTNDSARVDARADLYALGCTLYFALTGQPPYPGGTSREKILYHRVGEPTPVEDLAPGLPPGLAALVRKLMAKDPAERFQSAAEVRTLLLPWVPSEAALPLDRREDAGYARAVAELNDGSGSASDMLLDTLGSGSREVPAPAGSEPPPVPPSEVGHGTNVYLWICLGVLVFWIVLLIALGLFLLLS